MAELKIKADSGGGTVSFKGPATTTSNAAVQLTLPVDDGTTGQYLKTDGSGALSWATPTDNGKILQAQTASDSTYRTYSTDATWNQASSTAEVNITPATTGSKIFVIASGNVNCNDGNDGWYATIYRDSTNLGSSTYGLAHGNSVPGVSGTFFPTTMHVLDSPNTTSQVTYKVMYKLHDADSDGGNVHQGGTMQGSGDPIPMRITVMEIGA